MNLNKFFKYFLIITALIHLPLFFSCNSEKERVKKDLSEIKDLPQIRESGRMVVVTDFNSINYFIYRGRPMGFQYELLQELADYLGLELEVKVNNNLQENFESLVKGDVDLIASNLTITKSRKEMVAFTVPHSQTTQVLVQRVAEKSKENSTGIPGLIRNPLELTGKTIHVLKNSAYLTRLHSLSEEIGENINIIETDIETEQLIRMVAKGEIEYTVADENIARVNKTYYPGIDIQTSVSFPQNQAWAVRKEANELRKEIDTWFKDFQSSSLYAILYNKYFESSRSAQIVKSEYYYPETGRLSKYDKILKYESAKIGWDWRLLASMVYQESRFNHKVTSWAGAFGVMQLMPVTAKNYGIDEESSPEENIRAGVRLIKWLDDRFKKEITDENERIKFILASYNVGYGHVTDAIRLTEKYGLNPGVWENNVETFLLKKSEPEFYNDPVVKNGYCRGNETCLYVKEILYRYDHYLNLETLAAR